MALHFENLDIPLAAGVSTKSDPRALQPPKLAVCKNAEFDEIGGAQPRKPYAAITSHESNTIADIRRLAIYDNELVAFTKDGLWSYAAGDGKWTQRATYLAPLVTEATVFTTPNTQVDCDRAELDGIIMYCWSENPTVQSKIYVAAVDSETGSVVLSPSEIDGFRPRLVALDTKIHLYYQTTTTWEVREYDPTNLDVPAEEEISSEEESIAALSYDVCLNSTGDGVVFCTQGLGGAYAVALITEGPTVGSLVGKSGESSGPAIAVAVAGDGMIIVARWDNTNDEMRADVLDYSPFGSDWDVNNVLGSQSVEIDQINAAFLATTFSGEYRCIVTWSASESTDDTTFACTANRVDTNGEVGTANSFVKRLGIASRAFHHDGHIYMWLVFVGETGSGGVASFLGLRAQLQNTYYLYRIGTALTGVPVAKAAADRAGGLTTTQGRLPNVQSLGDNRYAWCGSERRVIELGGNHGGYGGHSPRDIVVELDADEARRTVQLGRTLYIAGGQLLQYDGRRVTELGFNVYPWVFTAAEASSGSIAAGVYTYKITWRAENAKGEIDRSTTATYGQVTVTGGSKKVIFSATPPLNVTLRTADNPAAEIWRTKVSPTLSAPFYLTTNVDPTDTSNPNMYLESDWADDALDTFDDAFADATLEAKQANPENGGVLPNLTAPPCSIIAASQDRLFVAGISDLPHRVQYSKLRGDGEVASFSDGLSVDLPPEGGAITAISFLNETLIAFKERAIYALPGDGFDNGGGGQNYGPARIIASDCGASNADALAITPSGILFHSQKGWYVLTHGWSVEYVGAPDYDGDTFVSCHVMEDKHQVRCLAANSRIVVWDYLANEWSEWTVADGLHAVVWDGSYCYADSDGENVNQEQANWSGNAETYALDLETPWIKVAGFQGMKNVRKLMILGEYRSAHRLRVRCAYNYAESDASGPTWVDDKLWTVSPTTVGGPLQVRHGPARPRCESIKIRITTKHATLDQDPILEGCRLTALTLKVGVQPGVYNRLPAAQTQ